jgi:hypothetical protein
MKRNKKNTSKAGISPYKKYKKKPYRYSEAYYAWRSKFRKREETA